MSASGASLRGRPRSRIPCAPLLAALGLLAGGCGGGDAGHGMVPASDSVTLLDVQIQVLGPRCATSGCHAGAGAPFGLDMSSVGSASANLVGVASAEDPSLLRVEPFDAADSYLYRKVSGDPRILGDPMPLSGAPLNAAELALIEDWIERGAM